MCKRKFAILTTLLLATASASATVRYVDLNNASPVSPYTSWATAAVTIQEAIDAAVAGDQIIVTNGVYQTGGRAVSGTNRVAVTKAVLVQSVNGPQDTIIHGYQPPGMPNGIASIRCVYLTNGATLSGFTLTNGAAAGVSGYGGGVWLQGPNAVASNCVISGNVAYLGGGGAYGAFDGSRLERCTVVGNRVLIPSSSGFGGGAYGRIILNNCLVVSNAAPAAGGTVYCILSNCTVVGNTATVGDAGGVGGGGLGVERSHNNIIYFNTAAQPLTANHDAIPLVSCCTVPPSGSASVTSPPQFVDLAGGDFRLQSNSPCINSGTNFYAPAGPDLDGNPRIVGGMVDIGAYEFQTPASSLPYSWLEFFRLLPADSSTDHADPDGDLSENWHEWRAGTNPTNASSVFRLLSPTQSATGLIVSWRSVTTRKYFLERSADLGAPAPFVLLQTNITGQASTTSYRDTNAAGNGPFFYRVGVQ